jgi:hypothetical protein
LPRLQWQQTADAVAARAEEDVDGQGAAEDEEAGEGEGRCEGAAAGGLAERPEETGEGREE